MFVCNFNVWTLVRCCDGWLVWSRSPTKNSSNRETSALVHFVPVDISHSTGALCLIVEFVYVVVRCPLLNLLLFLILVSSCMWCCLVGFVCNFNAMDHGALLRRLIGLKQVTHQKLKQSRNKCSCSFCTCGYFSFNWCPMLDCWIRLRCSALSFA